MIDFIIGSAEILLAVLGGLCLVSFNPRLLWLGLTLMVLGGLLGAFK